MVGDDVTAELEDGAFEGCLSRRMDAVSASGGMREQSDDASRTAPFIFPSDIFSEILSARNDLGSLGLLDTLGFERQTSRPTTRSSPSRLSKIFLRLPLTLDVSDFSLERLTLSRGGMCRHRYGRQRRCFQGANLEGSATTLSSAFWRTWAASGRAPRGILVRVFLLILLIVAKSCFALIAGTTGKTGGNDGIDREADDDADDDAATADADWEEDAGAAGAEEVEVRNIPEPLQRLLRGPCMRSAPTLVTGIEREQTGH